MKRTKSHQIDTKAQRILLSQLPTNWVKREQHPDYGIDYEIEVFQDEQSTGIWFRIQLKGKEKYRETEDSIAISFETDKIKYYLSKVPFPVFLFVVHVRKEEIHWLFLQKYVNEVLKVESPKWVEQKSVTIKIPKENIFDDNAKEIESEARNAMIYTNVLHFGTPPWPVAFKIKGAIGDIDKFEAERKKHLREQNEIDLQLALKYYEIEYRGNSQKLFFEVFDRTKGQDDHVSEHLSSIAGILSFYSVFDEKQNFGIFELSNYGYKLAEKIQNKRFIYFFQGSLLEAVYYKLIEKIQNSQIIQKVVDAQGRGTGSLLRLFQSEDYRKLLEISKQYSQNIYKSFENGEYWVSLDLLIRLIRINLFPYGRLLTERTKEELKPLLENASDLIENCMALANALGYIDLKCEILKYKALLRHFQNRDEYKDVLKSMKAFASEHHLNYYVKHSDDLLHEFNERSPFPEGPDDFPKPPPIEETPDEEIDKMHRMLAKAAGIDLEKDNGEIANVVRIGLKDRNPERILKSCSHLEVARGHYGIPGEMLGLPTAGSKFLFCKYGGSVYGLSLDSMYEGFRKDHCVNCEHHNPMPKDWKWSLAWQQEKDKKRTDEFQRFIDAVNRI
jgi:hypothetical protein